MNRELRHSEVHVWTAHVASLEDHRAGSSGSSISREEEERATRFVNPRDRRRYRFRRALLRKVLAEYLSCHPREIRYGYGCQGKPSVEGAGDFYFNLSRSGDHVAIAVTRCADIGIDIEVIREVPNAECIADHFFSHLEIAELGSVPADGRSLAFLRGWTRKEAFVKATGGGLASPLDEFTVSLSPSDQPTLRSTSVRWNAEEWSLWSFQPSASVIGAIALHSPDFRIRVFDSSQIS
jgi:4'-phosphopantetheinyl transferase